MLREGELVKERMGKGEKQEPGLKRLKEREWENKKEPDRYSW